jgi:DNA invertase Pin-like site-specific DNA recombinase
MGATTDIRRASIYCRVSTAEQVDGTSLNTQRASCINYCAARGWQVTGVYIDDGVSGAARSRPALSALIRSVREHDTDVVVIAKLDRLGRTMRGLIEWISEWDDHGVSLVSVSEAFDSSSPVTRMVRNLLATFAEFERDRITERTSEGRGANVAIGGWPGGPAPFGWRLVRPAGDRHTRLEIDKNEAATIRRAVELFVTERKTSTEIFQILNAERRPSRGGPDRTDRHTWSASKVKQMLARSDHWGGTWTFRSGGTGHPKNVLGPPVSMPIPPMLSAAEHDALKARLAETSATWGGTHVGDPYLLAGRIRAPHGTPMRGNWRKYRTSAYYMCGHTEKNNGSPRCACRTIQVELLDDLVWHTITTEVLAPAESPDRLGDLLRLTTGLRDAVARGDTALRHRVVAILDVQVQVIGWRTCPTCAGKGWLPDPKRLPKLKKRRDGPRMWAQKCPQCRGYRHVAEVKVTGVLPPMPEPSPTTIGGTPFRSRRSATVRSGRAEQGRRGRVLTGIFVKHDATDAFFGASEGTVVRGNSSTRQPCPRSDRRHASDRRNPHSALIWCGPDTPRSSLGRQFALRVAAFRRRGTVSPATRIALPRLAAADPSGGKRLVELRSVATLDDEATERLALGPRSLSPLSDDRLVVVSHHLHGVQRNEAQLCADDAFPRSTGNLEPEHVADDAVAVLQYRFDGHLPSPPERAIEVIAIEGQVAVIESRHPRWPASGGSYIARAWRSSLTIEGVHHTPGSVAAQPRSNGRMTS